MKSISKTVLWLQDVELPGEKGSAQEEFCMQLQCCFFWTMTNAYTFPTQEKSEEQHSQWKLTREQFSLAVDLIEWL